MNQAPFDSTITPRQLAERLLAGDETAITGLWRQRAEDVISQAIILIGQKLQVLEEKSK